MMCVFVAVGTGSYAVSLQHINDIVVLHGGFKQFVIKLNIVSN